MRFVVKRPNHPATRFAGPLAALVLVVLLAPAFASWSNLLQSGSGTSLLGRQPGRIGAAEEEACEHAAAVNEEVLGRYGCTVLRDCCLDQGRILIHTGQKTPGHHNWTDEPLFTVTKFETIVLPGYPEPLGTVHFRPASNWQPDIRAPTPLDPPDVWRPRRFNNCTLPLIFWPHYFSIYGEFFMRRVTALNDLAADGAYDDNVTFVVDTNGMAVPAFYQALLAPYSRHRVESLQEVSSRQRAAEGGPRCFSRLALCNIRHGTSSYKVAATKIREFYQQRYPEKFERPPGDEEVFRVAFINRSSEAQGGMRRIVNLGEALEQCRRWQLPPESKFERVECLALEDFRPDTMPEAIAQLQRVHALVSTHGSGVVNAFFLPAGSAVVEVMCWNFCGTWPEGYHRYGMEADQSVKSGYFRLSADKQHCSPGWYERNKKGSPTAYGRDQDIRLSFGPLGEILARIARGDVESTPQNWKGRIYNMTAGDECPPNMFYRR